MNKQSIRSFGIALFLVGAGIYGTNLLNIPVPGLTIATDDTQQLQQQVKQLEEQLAQDSATKQTEQATAAEQATNDVAESKLIIYRGITGYEISKKLQDAAIIDNAIDFELFLVNGGYSTRLQIGEFRLNSDMSYKEIAEILTTP